MDEKVLICRQVGYDEGMETKSVALGAAGAMLGIGVLFGGIAIANAQNAPTPAPVVSVTTSAPTTAAPTPTPEPVVTTTAPAPVVTPAPVAPAPAPVVEPAPVVQQPAPTVAPKPVPVAVPDNLVPVPVDSNGYIIGGKAPMGGGDGPGKVDLPTAKK